MNNLFYQFWIGKDINYKEIWDCYNSKSGQGYINKFKSIKSVCFQIKFDLPNTCEPLFMHEAVYKTLKGLFHDFKFDCLSKEQYEKSTPIFLYSIERGSSEWSFLLDPALISVFVDIIDMGFNFYSDWKLGENIKQIIQEIKTEQITIKEEKKKRFIETDNCNTIFKNLAKLNPKSITIIKNEIMEIYHAEFFKKNK
ncbi:hypothetical protein [Legionella spiritensis]|uniref:hypothetical protein n=1 Tax=Legionella spiritensis TaxID=452 RepID=UPI000F6BB222|nr:hypothetical protein [Legionella spiritensis]VEG91758.1 Uncharacterised protein [Legionella spiritensis]